MSGRNATFALALLAIGLAGCGGERKDTGAQGAAQEILPRSVGDDMLPYDQIRSQPPLATPASRDGDGARAAGRGGDAASEAGEEPAPEAGEAAERDASEPATVETAASSEPAP